MPLGLVAFSQAFLDGQSPDAKEALENWLDMGRVVEIVEAVNGTTMYKMEHPHFLESFNREDANYVLMFSKKYDGWNWSVYIKHLACHDLITGRYYVVRDYD